MDVIKITPEELRATASSLRLILPDAFEASVDAIKTLAGKYDQLAEKLESEKREALEFIPAKGVQA